MVLETKSLKQLSRTVNLGWASTRTLGLFTASNERPQFCEAIKHFHVQLDQRLLAMRRAG